MAISQAFQGRCGGTIAREHGLPANRFHYGTAALIATEPEQVGFVEVQHHCRRTSGVSVNRGGDAHVEVSSGFDAEVLRAIVTALMAP